MKLHNFLCFHVNHRFLSSFYLLILCYRFLLFFNVFDFSCYCESPLDLQCFEAKHYFFHFGLLQISSNVRKKLQIVFQRE